MLTAVAVVIRTGAPRSDRRVGVVHDLGNGMRGEYMSDGSFVIHVGILLFLSSCLRTCYVRQLTYTHQLDLILRSQRAPSGIMLESCNLTD